MNSFQIGVIEQLKSKRRKMSDATREKTRNPKLKGVFLYPFGIEKSYALYIKKLIQTFTERAEDLIFPQLEMWYNEFNRADGFGADWSQVNSSLLDLQKNEFDKNAGNLTAAIFSFGEKTEKWNQEQNNKFVKQILSEPVFPQEAWLNPVLDSWEKENFELIKGLSNDYIKQINTIVSTGLQTGLEIGAIKKAIRTAGETMTGSRARLIARDQVGKLNGLLTKRRNEELGLSMYEWSTSMDERVRSSHRPLNFKTCRWDNATVYSDDGGKTWKSRASIGAVEKHPGIDIQCFSGETEFKSYVPINKLFRRFYNGKLAEFVTESGVIFKSTLNHPILGEDGRMRSAQFFNIGDYIANVPDNTFLPLFESEKINRVSTFEESFNFYSVISPISTVPGVASDFHGDGIINNKIDVIDVKSFLPLNKKIVFDKRVIEEFFTVSNMLFSALPNFSKELFMPPTLFNTPDSVVRFFGYLFSLLRVTESQEIRLATISTLNSMRLKNPGYATACDIVFFRESKDALAVREIFDDAFLRKLFFIWSREMALENNAVFSSIGKEIISTHSNNFREFSDRHPGFIQKDRIIQKRLVEFSSHVYNLENEFNWYTITYNRFIVNNCRCTSLPIFTDLITAVDNLLKKE